MFARGRATIASSEWEPVGLFADLNFEDSDVIERFRAVLDGILEETEWIRDVASQNTAAWQKTFEIFMAEFRFAIGKDSPLDGPVVSDREWQQFLLREHPELTFSGEAPPEKISQLQVYVALEKALRHGDWAKAGVARSRDVGAFLWPGVAMSRNSTPTPAQGRVADALSRLVRDGRAVRYRNTRRRAPHFWTIPGVDVDESRLGRHWVREGGHPDA